MWFHKSEPWHISGGERGWSATWSIVCGSLFAKESKERGEYFGFCSAFFFSVHLFDLNTIIFFLNFKVVVETVGEGRKKKEATQNACANVLSRLRGIGSSLFRWLMRLVRWVWLPWLVCRKFSAIHCIIAVQTAKTRTEPVKRAEKEDYHKGEFSSYLFRELCNFVQLLIPSRIWRWIQLMVIRSIQYRVWFKFYRLGMKNRNSSSFLSKGRVVTKSLRCRYCINLLHCFFVQAIWLFFLYNSWQCPHAP